MSKRRRKHASFLSSVNVDMVCQERTLIKKKSVPTIILQSAENMKNGENVLTIGAEIIISKFAENL
jgi:hypothetical protein